MITGLFNRYNFTVMEATPIDTEVAVDPEMLGKLFEETVNERHSNGAYYTPRPVVAFMCREAIKGYLEGRNIADLTPAAIADLVDNANPQAVTVAQALEIASAVKDMKAVDPACGSGAFCWVCCKRYWQLTKRYSRRPNRTRTACTDKSWTSLATTSTVPTRTD